MLSCPSIAPSQTIRSGSDFETPIFESTAASLAEDLGVVTASAEWLARGESRVYALVGTPGHHAGPAYYSGFCYTNHACIACALLEDLGARTALVDVDFHGGNGSLDICRASGRWFRSINGAGAYPWVDMGMEGVDLPPGTTWEGGYRSALESVLSSLPDGTDVVVFSLGFDTLSSDPESGKRGAGLKLEVPDFHAMGLLLAQTKRSVLVVQEGGYDLDAVPSAAAAFVRGLASAS